MKEERGLTHIYFGEGKGKTTAALGLAMRAAGRGKKVCFIQFFKPKHFDYGEHCFIKKFCPKLKIVRFDIPHPFFSKDKKIDIKKMKKNIADDLKQAKKLISEGKFDIVVLDEIINVSAAGFIREQNIIRLVKNKPKHVELILTGRGDARALFSLADYITEFRKVRHPFDYGITARKGIEH